MVLCAGSKADRVVLVYAYEIILITKTKARSPNIKYYLVIYPEIPYPSVICAFANADTHTENLCRQ